MTRNVFSFNAAMLACEKGEQWRGVFLLLDKMCKASVTPNMISFSAAESYYALVAGP